MKKSNRPKAEDLTERAYEVMTHSYAIRELLAKWGEKTVWTCPTSPIPCEPVSRWNITNSFSRFFRTHEEALLHVLEKAETGMRMAEAKFTSAENAHADALRKLNDLGFTPQPVS
jgi:hypothetical protein